MITAIDPARRFQFWEYHVSHGTALIRSPRQSDEPANLDIMLFGVEYLAIPRHLDTVKLERANEEEWRRVERLLGRDVQRNRVWALVAGSSRHLLVAAKVEIRETAMAIFDSPFDVTEP